jgi:hypothetical protein
MFFLPNEVDKLHSSAAQTNNVFFKSNSVADYNFVSSSSFAQGCCSSQVSVSSASTKDECSSTAAADRSSDENQQKPFLQALMDLLSQEDPEIVTWLPSGTAFIVRSPKKFVEMVLPRFFKQTKIASFYRQLNMYGFRRIVDGPDMGAYHHELFVRDKPHLCSSILRKRRTRKQTAPKSALAGKIISSHSAMSSNPMVEAADTDGSCDLQTLPSTDVTIISGVAQQPDELIGCENLSPSPSVSGYNRTNSTGFSIIVCDHAKRSIAEVAHYDSIPCDLESFALGVGGLLADGIEQYKKYYANSTCSATTLPDKFPQATMTNTLTQNVCESHDSYCDDEVEVDIFNMFRSESLSSFHMAAC